MTQRAHSHDEALADLSRAVDDAAAFFAAAADQLCDGHQTARDVISHLVFWHREYVCIVWALATGRRHWFRTGSFASLNAQATQEFRREPLAALAGRLRHRQQQLVKALRRLPDWTIDFPLKQGGQFCTIADRVAAIESHIRSHLSRLQAEDRRRMRELSPAGSLDDLTVERYGFTRSTDWDNGLADLGTRQR
ncbi:MAG: hypothetical protein HYR71_09160 [Chloroflexi bacterium]|nr:hypothetical protein [Chloroflexota bacterium]